MIEIPRQADFITVQNVLFEENEVDFISL